MDRATPGSCLSLHKCSPALQAYGSEQATGAEQAGTSGSHRAPVAAQEAPAGTGTGGYRALQPSRNLQGAKTTAGMLCVLVQAADSAQRGYVVIRSPPLPVCSRCCHLFAAVF